MIEAKVLGVGVLGLGQQWAQRYRPALLALKSLFRIVAIADQNQQQVRREARLLPCAEAGGMVQLLEHPEIDVLLLADAQWHGLWPVELAAAAGKPLFCGISPGADPEHAEQLLSQLQSKPSVLVDLPARIQPTLLHLQNLCRTDIGPPQRMVCQVLAPPITAPIADGAVERLFPLAMLDLCAVLLPEEPRRLWAGGTPDGSLAQVLIELAGGGGATLTRCAAPPKRETSRIMVVAERGMATARLPARVQWSSAGTRWSRRWRRTGDPCQALLQHWHTAVVRGEALAPGFRELYSVWRWQQWAAQSWREGKWIECR
jgi:predicted dehydrogenase